MIPTTEEERDRQIYAWRKAGYSWVLLANKTGLKVHQLTKIYKKEDEKRREGVR